MSNDLAKEIESLQTLRPRLGETVYQALLVDLRTQFGDRAVDDVLRTTASPTSGNTQIIRESARVGAAVAGSVHGNIYINGQWTRDEATLVRQYLERLVARCETLPLQGIREQKSSNDILEIKLDRVYTQLVTTATQREVLDREKLDHFDATAYMRDYTRKDILPANQRLSVELVYEDKEEYPLDEAYLPGLYMGKSLNLSDLSADDLALYARHCEQLHFFGPQSITNHIATGKQLVLLGEPGSGKSTALRYLALTLAEAGLHEKVDLSERLHGWERLGAHNRPLPIFYPLLTFAQRLAKDASLAGTAHDLWNALADFIDPAQSNTGLATVVRDRLHSGNVLLLLDGLDEVATVESRRKVVQAVQQFATEFQHCRIVVTCRVRAYEGERNSTWQLPGWPKAILAEWTLGQMEHFIAAWYQEAALASERGDKWREERVVALNTAISRRADLQRLGARPLLLTIMALVHFNDGRLPEDSVSLYRRCIEILLGQWELGRPDGTAYGPLMNYIGLPNNGIEALRPLLEDAAFRAHEAKTDTDQGSLSSHTLRLMVMEALNERGHPNPFDGAERFLDYTDKRAGLLQASDAGDDYVFPHLTFQEYLAGVHLVSGLGVVDKIMARHDQDRWRIPIMLGVGDHVSGNKLEMPYRLFDELLMGEERPPQQQERDMLFAADLGKELGWDRLEQGDKAFRRIRRELALQLGSVVEGSVLPAAERVRAGVYLSELGDLREGVCVLPPEMIVIPGGSFVIGIIQDDLVEVPEDRRDEFGESINDQPVTIAPFAIGRYLVTNAQYALFIADDGYNPNALWWDDAGRAWLGSGRHHSRLKASPNIISPHANQPVVDVSWYEAMAYCRWLTHHQSYNQEGYCYNLPTEAEWEYVARGTTRRPYPWGDSKPDEERANFNNHDGTTTVGCFPLGGTPEGVLDLAGNVWEWTRSKHLPYPYDPMDGREDFDDGVDQDWVVLRGGAWHYQESDLHTAYRLYDRPASNFMGIVGFRLARYVPV